MHNDVPSCMHCGYDLGGLSFAGNCPECGTPIQASIEIGLRKRDERSMLICGIVLFVVVQGVLGGSLLLMFGGSSSTGVGLILIVSVLVSWAYAAPAALLAADSLSRRVWVGLAFVAIATVVCPILILIAIVVL